MPTKKQPDRSPLITSAEHFDDSLSLYASLANALRKASLDSQHGLERAAQALGEIAQCEDEMQGHAQALMAALGDARDAQQAQAEMVRARAGEIQRRSEEYRGILARFDAMGRDAVALNTTAQALAIRARTAEQMVRDPALLAELDELQERMTAVATAGTDLAADARTVSFEELSRKFESLIQQLLAARNKIGLLKGALVRAMPPQQPS